MNIPDPDPDVPAPRRPPPPPDPTAPRLERQIDPGAARRFGKGGAGCLGTSAGVIFLSGSQYVLLMPGTHLAQGLVMWLTAATFAVAAFTAWRGWVWTTLLWVAAAFAGPVLVMELIRRIAALL